MLPRPVITGLTVLISLVWTGNVVVGFVDPALRDPTINAVFAIVVGGLYALGRNDNTRERTEPPAGASRAANSTQDGGDP